MGYSIVPTAYRSMFALPREVVDQHLKLAGSAQLKALLYVCSRPGEELNAQDIAAGIGLSRADTVDALQYWMEAGLILEGAPCATAVSAEQTEQKQVQPSPPVPEVEKPTKPARVLTPIGKPTREEVTRRGEQSPEIAWMLNEAQMRFGRPISASEMATLVWLHDSEGLPPAVILMIIEYALSVGKCNMRYIERVAISWADEEIDTVEKAEQKLTQLERKRQAWGRVQSAFGMQSRSPSAKEEALAVKWLDEWKFSPDMLRYAYDQCVDQTGKFSMAYINKVLEKCYHNGLMTPQQAQAASEKKPAPAKKRGTSYDIDEVEQLLMHHS